jgi:hypothetical protein
VPANEINPRLMPGVSPVAKSFAATWAARRRVGRTSVASIDSDTSITSITVARLRGTRWVSVGPAIAVVSSISAMISTTGGRCRIQPCRFGATRSSSSRFVKRMTRLRRVRCTRT